MKNRITRGAAWIAGLALALSMAACASSPAPADSGADANTASASNGQTDKQTDAASEPQAEGIKIVLFGPSSWDTFAPGASEDVVKEVTKQIDDAFMAKYPEVTEIVHDSRGTVSDGLSRLMTAQMAEEQIDIIYTAVNPLRTSYQPKGLVVPVNDIAEKVKDFMVEGAVSQFEIKGDIWGVPLSGNTSTGFFYNKDLFERYNLEEPKTIDEFAAAAKVLSENGITPVLHQGKNPWMWPMWYMHCLPLTTGNKQLEKTISNLKGETKFTDPEDVRAMELFNEFIAKGILDKTSLDLDEEGNRSAFMAQKSAAYLAMTIDLPILRSNSTDFELGFFPFPTAAGEPGHAVGYGGIESGLSLSATSKGQSMEYAKLYMEHAVQPEMARLALEPMNNVATSHKDVLGSDDPIASFVRDNMLPSEMFLDWVWPRELCNVIQADIQSMVGGTMTPQQVMEDIQKAYDDLVAQGYVYPF